VALGSNSGEWAWVSGASSGIGREVALRLARDGFSLFLSARRENLLNEACAAINQQGGTAHSIPADLTKSASLEAALNRIQQLSGRLDIVVCSAGVELLSPFHLLSEDKWRKILDVNVIASFEMVRASLPLLRASGQRQNGQGRVVLISSAAANRGWPAQSAYSASKAALLGGMRSLCVELAPAHIRVNAVLPGMVNTEMQKRMFARIPKESAALIAAAHPLGLGQPEDVAAAVAFLVSQGARWITGACLSVDGGLSCA
jgi:NAD(P)-dependent dehydrogenase (short-subunit alcohol dehydrogenase family)